MTAVLLTSICALRGHLPEALIHARNGLRLFYQWDFWQYMKQPGASPSQAKTGVLRSESIVMLMVFLEYQLFAFTHTTERPARTPNYMALMPPSSEPFESVTEAYFSLLLLMSASITAWSPTHAAHDKQRTWPLPDHRLASRRALSQWRCRFRLLRQSLRAEASSENIVWRLELYCAAIETTLHADPLEPGFTFLPPDSMIERMLVLVDRIAANEVDAKGPSHEHGHVSASALFSFSLSVTSKLGMISIFCRKKAVRQRMLAMLQRWPRAESIWCGKLIAGMAEAVHRVEDEGLVPDQQPCSGKPCAAGEYVCFHHRVMTKYVAVNEDGTLEVRIQSVRDIQSGAPERKFLLDDLRGDV